MGIIKQLEQKIRFKKKKRTTFRRLFIKALCVALVATAVFGVVFYKWLMNEIYAQTLEDHSFAQSRILTQVSNDDESGSTSDFNALTYSLTFATRFDVVFDILEQPLVMSNLDDSYACSAIVLTDGTMVADNNAVFIDFIEYVDENGEEISRTVSFSATPEDYPELEEFYEMYYSDSLSPDLRYNPTRIKSQRRPEYIFSLSEVYYDSSTDEIIPRKGCVFSNISNGVGNEAVYRFGINIDDDRFEIVKSSPMGMVFPGKSEEIILSNYAIPSGTRPEQFEKMMPFFQLDIYADDFVPSSELDSWKPEGSDSNDMFIYSRTPIKYNGQDAYLCIAYLVNPMSRRTIIFLTTVIGGFLLITVLIALVWSWRRNVINSSTYAMEDYQKALINNLAHDLKTPFTAIGGFAENLIEIQKGRNSQDENNYLNQIIRNVNYADSIISRAFELNKINGGFGVKKETLKIKTLVHEIVEKHTDAIKARNLTVSISGDIYIEADRNSLVMAIDNLITNAIKYANEGGTIIVSLLTHQKKILSISNEIDEEIDTTDLKKPFVMGDKARSGKKGTGLGLAIADSSCKLNGFELDIYCKNNKFFSDIVF
ncbi:MAG: HAMP domain-containing histidine kinase [Oscillospiraceae bacterium]|nr:HAMP domain-containing histidine kinase [Oscillospiraceae bacterium]